jgi:hypothetical protein
MVPISIQYLYKPKAAKGEPEDPEPEEGAAVNYVTKIMKNRLWESLIPYFTLSTTEFLELAEAQKEKVREWALKKMVAQFNNHKKRLWNAYVKADRQAPEFTGPNENMRDHWDAFVEYKESELGKLRSTKNKINAAKKKYHHTMGPGGYKITEPKWDMQEAALREKGIEPETEHWPRRSRNWALGHGAVYDERTRKLVQKKKQIADPLRELVKTIAKVQEGTFQPDRENEELTKALKNKEHTG